MWQAFTNFIGIDQLVWAASLFQIQELLDEVVYSWSFLVFRVYHLLVVERGHHLALVVRMRLISLKNLMPLLTDLVLQLSKLTHLEPCVVLLETELSLVDHVEPLLLVYHLLVKVPPFLYSLNFDVLYYSSGSDLAEVAEPWDWMQEGDQLFFASSLWLLHWHSKVVIGECSDDRLGMRMIYQLVVSEVHVLWVDQAALV